MYCYLVCHTRKKEEERETQRKEEQKERKRERKETFTQRPFSSRVVKNENSKLIK